MKEKAIPKGTKDAVKSGVILFEGKIWNSANCNKKKFFVNCSGNVVDVDGLKWKQQIQLNSRKIFFI